MSSTPTAIQEFVPTTQGELCRFLAENAAGARQAISTAGGRTSMDFGEPLDRPHLALSSSGLARVIDFPARDMTVTVEAGIRVDRLADLLREQGLRLPIDIPQSQRATLGGAVACNANGPRRFEHGTFRDYVIGLSAATADGRLFHSGGRVVKNVAGYDLCKLLVGSLGTLAVVAQVTLKLKPIPATSEIVCFAFPQPRQVETALETLTRSATRPVALEVLNPSSATALEVETRSGLPVRSWILLAAFEGSERQVRWECETIQKELSGLDRSAAAIAEPAAMRLLTALGEFTVPSDEPLAFQAGLLPSRTIAFLERCDGLGLSVVARGASGVVVGKLPDDVASAESAQRVIAPLRALAEEAHGALTILHCDPQWKSALRVFGTLTAADSMRRLKRALDPHGLLNSGRLFPA